MLFFITLAFLVAIAGAELVRQWWTAALHEEHARRVECERGPVWRKR